MSNKSNVGWIEVSVHLFSSKFLVLFYYLNNKLKWQALINFNNFWNHEIFNKNSLSSQIECVSGYLGVPSSTANIF